MINKEDIKQEEQDIQKSLNYFILNELENTELGYVNIKGSDVKEKLLIQKGGVLKEMESCIRGMNKMVNMLGEQPSEPCPGMPSLYKYSYKQIYPNDYLSDEKDNNPSDEYLGFESLELKKEVKEDKITPDRQEKMREYNRYAHGMINAKENLGFIKQMIDNIKENKEYKLPIRVANHLGIE